jgi:hypothetical protein
MLQLGRADVFHDAPQLTILDSGSTKDAVGRFAGIITALIYEKEMRHRVAAPLVPAPSCLIVPWN